MSMPPFRDVDYETAIVMGSLLRSISDPNSIVNRETDRLKAKRGPAATSNKSILAKIEKRETMKKTKRENIEAAAEARKDQGNIYFRTGEYEKAEEEYLCALDIRKRSTYFANLAATYLKMERFEEANQAAFDCLELSPRLIKARYRRALARKELGMTKSAIADFRAMLRQDPDSAEAKTELVALEQELQLRKQEQLKERRNPKGKKGKDRTTASTLPTASTSSVPSASTFGPKKGTVPEDEFDDYTDNDYPDENESCTSKESNDSWFLADDIGEGNGIACRYYNHDGCARGGSCWYRHGGDMKSVRDKLGKNVCLYFLAGNCRFGEKCVYSHSKAALSAESIWHHEELVKEYLEATSELRDFVRREENHERDMHRLLYGEPSGLRGGGGRGGRGRGRKGKRGGRGKQPRALPRYDSEDDESEDDFEERMMNHGFTNDELNDLLSQGVKPWDDDAYDVLAAINGYY